MKTNPVPLSAPDWNITYALKWNAQQGAWDSSPAEGSVSQQSNGSDTSEPPVWTYANGDEKMKLEDYVLIDAPTLPGV